MSRITINGKTFEIEGSLSMINGVWHDGAGRVIDMNNLDGLKEAKIINITIEGNVDRLKVDGSNTITVNGNVGKVHTGSGDITCKDIDGDAQTGSGDIRCETIEGDAQTGSGNIYVNKVSGRTTTGSGTVFEDGVARPKRSSSHSEVFVNSSLSSIFGSSSIFGASEVITGGFTMTKGSDGKKYMTMSKDCTYNGRRLGDMSESELQSWIETMAKKGKIVTIR